MDQIQYIKERIERLNEHRGIIPEAFAKEAREIDAAIEALILASSNGSQIVALRMKKEEVRNRLTSQSASLGGQIEALQELFNRYYINPVADGTIAHGIDVSKLDWETRAQVLNGNLETIALLGGTWEAPLPVETVPVAEPAVAEPEASVPNPRRKR